MCINTGIACHFLWDLEKAGKQPDALCRLAGNRAVMCGYLDFTESDPRVQIDSEDGVYDLTGVGLRHTMAGNASALWKCTSRLKNKLELADSQ